MPSHEIHEGDALAILRTLPSDHYHGSLTDPPYGLSFMGHAWDHGVPSAEVWAEVLRCLRPGAHLLAFGGTRTFHRLTCAIEDAGFEIRDCMQWIYGSGFPKSHDVSKAIDREAGATREVVGERKQRANKSGAAPMNASIGDVETITAPATEAARKWAGHGTALKPAWEPIIVARKPLDGTVAQNVQQWGCGGLAIDACRIDGAPDPASWTAKRADGDGLGRLGQRSANVAAMNAGLIQPPTGRWPANVILSGEAGQALDAQTGTLHTHSGNVTKDMATVGFQGGGSGSERKITSNSGGASRFFQSCDFSTGEVVFSRAMAIIDGCNFDHASIATSHLAQSRRAADSALSDAVILVSQGATRLAGWTGLSTSATPSESRLLSATLIAAILSIAPRFLPGSPLESVFPSGSRASVAVGQGPTGTMRITVSHWRSDGSAEPVTFNITRANSGHGEAGSASRFIYCPKASRSERDAGLEEFEAAQSLYTRGTGLKANGDGSERSERSESRNIHPTVKPIALARYLARLILPPVPDARMLTPFSGSGSEVIGALQAGWSHVDGIDSWDVAVRISRARIAHWSEKLSGAVQLDLTGE